MDTVSYSLNFKAGELSGQNVIIFKEIFQNEMRD